MNKSKKTTLKLFICVLTLLMLATVLVACNIGNVPDHYDYLVTFEYNVGTGDNALRGNTDTQYLGILGENSLISIRPGFKNDKVDLPEGIVNGYYLEGWYLPAHVDETTGEPLRDANGFVVLGQKWNFNTMRVSENITLYGNFKKKLLVRFIDRNIGNGEPYYIEHTIDYNPNALVLEPTSKAPTLTGHTFLGNYYKNLEGEKFDWNFRIQNDVDVYVDFIDGIWELIDNETDFKTAINADRNIYLQKDLDFKNVQPWNFRNYTGQINGNGHTISNITRKITAAKTHSDDGIDSFGGIFGSLSGAAKIFDINFLNVQVEFDINSSYLLLDAYIGLLAGKVEAGAEIKNVSVSGTLKYKSNNDKTIYVGDDGVIGDNKGSKQDCDFSGASVQITAA
ncbi:MAG: hypothetical protein NC037_00115 [Bacteroides sp.]|nr:hypothetical protein [Bacillota bacterium]MCM1393368.1 hypothetical protein [[Eubacterium] siraeum]MCM1454922.1 hypothetical protein [Bacteroides sp.]